MRISILLIIPMSVAINGANLVVENGLDTQTGLCFMGFDLPGVVITAWIAMGAFAFAILFFIALHLVASYRTSVTFQVYLRNVRRLLALVFAITVSYGPSIFCVFFTEYLGRQLPAHVKEVAEFAAASLCWELVLVLALFRVKVEDGFENELQFRTSASFRTNMSRDNTTCSSSRRSPAGSRDNTFGSSARVVADGACDEQTQQDALSCSRAADEELLKILGAEFCLTPSHTTLISNASLPNVLHSETSEATGRSLLPTDTAATV
jgi:hypothetical protein